METVINEDEQEEAGELKSSSGEESDGQNVYDKDNETI